MDREWKEAWFAYYGKDGRPSSYYHVVPFGLDETRYTQFTLEGEVIRADRTGGEPEAWQRAAADSARRAAAHPHDPLVLRLSYQELPCCPFSRLFLVEEEEEEEEEVGG